MSALIDFELLGMPVFTGRSRGLADRKKLRLDQLDQAQDNVVVRIPQGVYTVTSSYFLGLFGESIRFLGRDGFLTHYIFEAPTHVAQKIDDWIARALRNKKSLFGGDPA